MLLKDLKNWNIEIEKKITDKWKTAELFKFDRKTKKKIYSIDTPPPYVNAPVHIGQAVTYCYMDFFARYKRMKGFEVIFPLGLDRNGLPIEMAAEKTFGVSPIKDGRDKFIKACKKLLEKTSSETEDSYAKLGISFTSYKQGNHIGSVYLTDSPEYRAMTQLTFIELFKRGLIYEDKRINNWDSKLQTTIADSEIEYKDLPSTFNYVKWKVKETGEDIIIATTRPELICTCGMVLFNPSDKRYKHLNRKTAISPIFEKEIPIKADKLADVNKGTGIVMMCSGGDLTDNQFFREHELKPVIAVNQDGTMNANAGVLKGLKVKHAREKMTELLQNKHLLIKQEQIIHRTPVSERSGVELEFIEMPEFYLKQIEFKEDIKKISNKINFYPPESKKLLFDWIDSIKIDWPISRRRFYATPIPLWNAKNGNDKVIAVANGGRYYESWKEFPEKDFEVYLRDKKIGTVGDFKDLKWEGETRVLDTWMDSSISELIMLKYKEDDEFFKRAFPATLRPQGKEIIRTWLYYTLLRGYLETKKPCFEDIWINQHIVDNNGLKMSKSKGNVVDPQKLLKLYGAEAIRLWASISGDLAKQDLKCSEERINNETKTLNKILNVARFIMLFKKPDRKPKITEIDKFFIDYVEDMTKRIDSSYMKYDFYHPSLELKEFLWEILASHYIEIVKSRAYNQEGKFSEEECNSAKYTLHYLFERFLFLMHPIIPQITSFIAAEKGIDLLKEQFPEALPAKANLKLIEKLIEFNSNVWKEKKEKGISLRNEIGNIKIPKELKAFEKDLISAHNLK